MELCTEVTGGRHGRDQAASSSGVFQDAQQMIEDCWNLPSAGCRGCGVGLNLCSFAKVRPWTRTNAPRFGSGDNEDGTENTSLKGNDMPTLGPRSRN